MAEKTLSVAGRKCRAIINQGNGVPVVFLHGYSFTSDAWQRAGATELLKEKKVPFMALDMPYGAKSECQPRTRNVDANVAVVKEAVESVFASAEPVLVGASMGGNIALHYAARYPVKGLLLLAPVRTLEPALLQAYANFKFPVRIIIGSEDRVASAEELRELTGKLPDAKLIVYENEGHVAYLGRPDKFRKDLMELYALSEQ